MMYDEGMMDELVCFKQQSVACVGLQCTFGWMELASVCPNTFEI
jgi:hypothetical protein